MTKRPTRPKLQVMSDVNSVTTTTVPSMIRASATSFGSHICSRFWTGQMMAMISSANASGAKTVPEKLRAVTTRMAAQIPTDTRRPRSLGTPPPSLGARMGNGPHERASIRCGTRVLQCVADEPVRRSVARHHADAPGRDGGDGEGGSLVVGLRTEIGRATSGFAARAGAPTPDIWTPD